MNPVESLRAAADHLDELAAAAEWEAWRGAQDHADMAWIEAMSPQVAPALSAWLRAEADTAQASDQTRANFRPNWRDDWSPEDPPPDWSEANRVAALEAMHRHPLAFARMVLGLPAGDAS